MHISLQSFNIDFLHATRQFDWVEISLVYDKSDKHTIIYNSYNAEKASQFFKSIELENISEAYTLTNMKKLDISNETQKHMLYKQFADWNCNGCSIVPLTDYIHNPVLPTKDEYFWNNSDERIYINLRDSYGYTNEKPTWSDLKMIIKDYSE